ncbi:MAG TPA: GNAT family N-acetyltransferase [bacterium]
MVASSLKIRPFREDYTAFVAIWNAVFEDYPISERYARHEDSRYDGARYLLRRFVAEVGGAVSGMADFHHATYMYHPRKFFLDVRVRPEFRQRGIGSALYDRLIQELASLRPLTFWGMTRETFTPSLAFAEHRGFRESRRAWESRLDVRRFDPSPFRSRTDAAARGYRVVTVAEEQTADPRWLEKLHDLHMEVAADVPQPEPYTPITVEELRRRLFDHPDYLPGGHYLAKDGDRYVAESNLFLTENPPDVLYQGITGARREYRGRGLALVLKLRTIEYARARGKREIRTWNDTLNAPMLAINTKLGFVRQPSWITFEKVVDSVDGGAG